MATKSLSKPSSPTLLDQKFWNNFAQKYWEKKPLFARNLQSPLSEMSDGEIFNLLVLYSDQCRKLKDPEGFKFYIDGFQCAAEDVLQILPEKKDKSLLGYHTRMQALFSDYCLVCDELLRVNHLKQHLLTDFTDELYRHVGFPNRFSEMGLYLGSYRKTPFGVHVDSCGVFSFPVVGKKRFRLWTSDFAKKNPGLDRSFKYDKYKKDSQVFEAGPGDMTYWPSSMWHIAESDGSFNATWSLGVWVDQTHKDLISDSLNDLLEKKMGPSVQAATTHFKTLHNEAGEVTNLPDAFVQCIEQLQKLSSLELQETFLKSWMKHISSRGFKTLPKVEFKISAQSQLRLRSEKSLIFWRASLTSKKIMFLSFGGCFIESPKSPGLLKLIKDLNDGQTCQLQSYLKGPHQRKNIASVQWLANAGAFSKATNKAKK